MTTNTRTYPYKAWTILPSGKPTEIELVMRYGWRPDSEFDKTIKGRIYDSTKLALTKEAAIEAEWNRLSGQEAKITRQLEKIANKRAVLAKARTEA